MKKIFFLLSLILILGCQEGFLDPNYQDGVEDRITPPGSIPMDQLPFEKEKFGYGEPFFSKHKIVSDSGIQELPRIHANKIVYVDRASMSGSDIYLYDRASQQKKILMEGIQGEIIEIQFRNDIVSWIERNNERNEQGEYECALYAVFTNYSKVKSKINSLSCAKTMGHGDHQMSHMRVQNSNVYWSEYHKDKGVEVHFYDFLTKSKQIIPDIKTSDFEVQGQWMIYQPGRTDLFAYHLISGERFRLNSKDSKLTDQDNTYRSSSYLITQDLKVFWRDERYTRTSIYYYDLNKGSKEEEQFFFVSDRKNDFSLLDFHPPYLILTNGGSIEYFDLVNYRYFQNYKPYLNEMKGYAFSEGKMVFSYNDSLYKDNEDIFLME